MRTMLIGLLLAVTPAVAQAPPSKSSPPPWDDKIIDWRKEAVKWNDLPLPKISPERLEAMRNYKPGGYCMMYYITPTGLAYNIYNC